MNAKLREKFTAPFSKEQIKIRPGANGEVQPYIDIKDVISRLNVLRAEGLDWSAPVNHYEILEEPTAEVIVLREFYIGEEIFIAQFGGRKYDSKTSIGDALKSANADALKKCCHELGMPCILPQMSEFEYKFFIGTNKEEKVMSKKNYETNKKCGNSSSLFCSDCKEEITRKEFGYSKKYYGKPLCRKCQKSHQKINNAS